MAYGVAADPSRRAEMWFDGPARQRRWTVLLRLVLVIPQYVVLVFLALAVLVVVIIGWFGALFMGRLPEWAHGFIGGVVRWQTRVGAYFYLLTDRYPPFTFEDAEYPARPILPPPNGKLNRWSVLFRAILSIPAAFFVTFVTYGLVAPLLLVTWAIVLISGRMPTALYWAYAALNRYGLRYQAFVTMLTSEYPWGMLGDREPRDTTDPFGYPTAAPFAWPLDPPAQAVPTTPGEGGPISPIAPADVTTEATGPSTSPAEQPGPIAPAPAPAPPAPAPAAWTAAPPPPPPWSTASAPPPPPSTGTGLASPPFPPPSGAPMDRGWLTLPSAARGWLIFAIIWGAIAFGTQTTLNSIIATENANRTLQEYNTVAADFNQSKFAVDNAISTARRCTTVECLRPSHVAAAASLRHFASDVRAMDLPSNAQQPGQLVVSDATQLASAFDKLANSANVQAYGSTVQSSGVNTLLQTVPHDTNSLLNALNHDLNCPPASTGFTICG